MRNLAQTILGRRRDRPSQPQCSFCLKPGSRVGKLIAGPGVYICDECVEFCNEILEEERSQGRV